MDRGLEAGESGKFVDFSRFLSLIEVAHIKYTGTSFVCWPPSDLRTHPSVCIVVQVAIDENRTGEHQVKN